MNSVFLFAIIVLCGQVRADMRDGEAEVDRPKFIVTSGGIEFAYIYAATSSFRTELDIDDDQVDALKNHHTKIVGSTFVAAMRDDSGSHFTCEKNGRRWH